VSASALIIDEMVDIWRSDLVLKGGARGIATTLEFIQGRWLGSAQRNTGIKWDFAFVLSQWPLVSSKIDISICFVC
jgi:hypothetical protein